MKFINIHDTSRTANPRPDALKGFDLQKELREACKTAVKPISKKLATYRSERARLEANCARWNPEAYNGKLNEIATRAHAGDEEAAHAIEAGAVPSRQSFVEMHARTYLELENFDRDSRALFAEVLPLVKEPMTTVVAKGQAILDSVLEGVGVPKFELTGWTNHNAYIWLQLEHASRNESADLAWFWSAVE